MIPSATGFLAGDFELSTQPSKTYRMDLDGSTTVGYVDGLEAMKQVVFKILNTERYKYPMYSWNYGVEFADLIGEPVTFVCPELQRRITEALTWDERVTSVSDFKFDLSKKGSVAVSFIVHTIYGSLDEEQEVNF